MAAGPGTCGSSAAFGQLPPEPGNGTGPGSRSNRSRRGSSWSTTATAGQGGSSGPPDHAIDIIDPSGKEKTVNFANCVSPPSPHEPGFMGINNEAYPCDCCQIDETQFKDV